MNEEEYNKYSLLFLIMINIYIKNDFDIYIYYMVIK